MFNGVLTVSEYRGLLEQAGFVVESYNDRSKEWSRYVFNRSNNHIKDGDELKAQLGEAWYNEFALKWSGESVWKLYHDVDMTIEEVEEKFPHLVSHNGRETVERILNSPQKMSGNYFVCRKPEN